MLKKVYFFPMPSARIKYSGLKCNFSDCKENSAIIFYRTVQILIYCFKKTVFFQDENAKVDCPSRPLYCDITSHIVIVLCDRHKTAVDEHKSHASKCSERVRLPVF